MTIENLPDDVRELVQAYLQARPTSFAAQVRPRFGLDEDQWYVLYGPNRRTGVTGYGATVTSALASWEANYREATTAEQ